ncbi:MAG: LysR family transcriptional regulator [Cohaesibacteraceae bacterium]|nr:LysR family transcriptional regulator [Cohaesibacteraceae bacterium]MBL4875868.1 LysR family transcriptional regulator [Cohaesibacteraceae bacterium]
MSDLNALLIYAKVVDAGSFSQASRILGMPISTVSRKIAELEDQLGVRLLERSTRQMRLTDIGKDVLEQARQSEMISDSISELVKNQSSEVQGALRLTASPGVNDCIIGPLLLEFQPMYPDIRVNILIADRYIDLIAEGADLAIRLGPLADSTLIAKKILHYRHVVVASPQYIEKFGIPETPLDLANHRYVAFSFGSPQSTRRFTKDGIEEVVNFKPHLAMNGYPGLAKAIANGAGLGDLTPVVAAKYLKSGEVVEVLADWKLPPVDLFLVHLGNRHLPKQVRIFMDFAVKRIPELYPDLPC